jgi:hypothetical protein
VPTRRPSRAAVRKSARRCSRAERESTRCLRFRRRASRGPYGVARTGSRDQRGCASATGSRASSPAGGCSAGTCACSRQTPKGHAAAQVAARSGGRCDRSTVQRTRPATVRASEKAGQTRSSPVGDHRRAGPSIRHAGSGGEIRRRRLKAAAAAVSVSQPAFPPHPAKPGCGHARVDVGGVKPASGRRQSSTLKIHSLWMAVWTAVSSVTLVPRHP